MHYPAAIRYLLVGFILASTACSQSTTQSAFKINADNPLPNGAWTRQASKEGKDLTEILLFSDGYYSLTVHETGSGAFIMTKGGSYTKSGMSLKLQQEFHSLGAEQLGVNEEWTLQAKGKEMSLMRPNETIQWQPMDVGQKTALTGAWLFSGRERDGEMQRRDTNQARKTMKLLTGTRFQWIAFNTDTGEFFGTGGGEYTAENGAYVEKIRFFSRNNDRVGAELPFEFEAEGSDWHHRGKSSSGDPMYEIWSKRVE